MKLIYRYETRNMVEFKDGSRASYSKKRYGPLLEKVCKLAEELDRKVWNYFEENRKEIIIFYWEQKTQQVLQTKIDVDKKHLLFSNYWTTNANGYFFSRTNNEKVYLHSAVIGYFGKDKVVDHIDRNPKNNLLSNLRIVSFSQNGLNKGTRNTYWDKKCNKWRGRVVFEGKEYTEWFLTEEEAFLFTQKLKQKFLQQ